MQFCFAVQALLAHWPEEKKSSVDVCSVVLCLFYDAVLKKYRDFWKIVKDLFSVPNHKSNADVFHLLALIERKPHGICAITNLYVYLISERRSASGSAFRLTFQFREKEVHQRSLKVILMPYMFFIRSDTYYNLELLVLYALTK